MKQAYVTAVVAMVPEGKPVETVLANTKAALDKKGHTRLWGAVLRGAVRELTHMLAANAPKIVLAKNDAATLANAKAALVALQAEGEAVVVVDETLIGGFIASAKHQIVDSSYKRALLDVYRKVSK
jgi:hypothetical protein